MNYDNNQNTRNSRLEAVSDRRSRVVSNAGGQRPPLNGVISEKYPACLEAVSDRRCRVSSSAGGQRPPLNGLCFLVVVWALFCLGAGVAAQPASQTARTRAQAGRHPLTAQTVPPPASSVPLTSNPATPTEVLLDTLGGPGNWGWSGQTGDYLSNYEDVDEFGTFQVVTSFIGTLSETKTLNRIEIAAFLSKSNWRE